MLKRKIAFFIISVCVVSFVFYSLLKGDHPEIIYNQLLDFENSSVSNNLVVTNGQTYPAQESSKNIWLDSHKAREGKKSIGFMLYPKESRREIRVADISNNTKKYIGFSVYFPKNYKIPTNWNLFAQWWQGAPASPPIAFEITPHTPDVDKFQMRILTRHGPYSDNNITVQYNGIIEKDEWIDFVVEMRIDDTGGTNGILNVWKNGKLIVKYSGPLGYPNLYNHTNFRFGLYRSPDITSTVKVYFDDIKIGDRLK